MSEKTRAAAQAIYGGGAVNPRAITRTLVEAIDEAAEVRGTADMQHGPQWAGARLILAQLSFLFGQGIGDYPEVMADMAACGILWDGVDES